MESGAPDNTRIFFKDKQNELKGPYTERQVQEGYRKEYFESSSQFYFVTENEQPSDDTEFITLDTLSAHNGIGCPFKCVDRSIVGIEEKKKKEKDNRMNNIEKELAQLRVKCEAVTGLQKRIEEMKSQLKKLAPCEDDTPTRSDNAEKKPAQQIDKKREDEFKKFNEWTNYFSNYYMVFVDALDTEHTNKMNKQERQCNSIGNLILANEEARLMCVDKIIEKLKTRDYFFCALCGYLCYNYKQFFIHMIDPFHMFKEKANPNACYFGINFKSKRIMGGLPSRWKKEEEVYAAMIAEKYASVRLDESRLYPNKAFAKSLDNRYGNMMMDLVNPSGELNTAEFSQVVASFVSSWKTHFLHRFMAEVNKHVGTEMTYCSSCRVVTGTREEYYKHLLLTTHKKDPGSTALTSLVFITVNMLKKDLAD